MRKIHWCYVLFLLSFFIGSCVGDHDEIILSGKYTGENLFIQDPSPRVENPKAFCIQEILLNNKVLEKNAITIRSTAIEINLQQMQLKDGDAVNIVIKTLKGCKPVVLNPEAI